MTISTLVKIDAIMISYSGTMGKKPGAAMGPDAPQ